MGLEVLELIIKIEERFQTHIPDSEAGKILTVGHLYDFLMQRIQRQNSNHSTTSEMFYGIQKILENSYNIDRTKIQLGSILNELLHPTERFKFWQTVEQELAIGLPRLRRSKVLKWHGDRFPEHISTVGDLACVCGNCSSISSEFRLEDKHLVWLEVCKIIGEIADIEPDKLSLETHFNKDLGF
jgi:acyl carrier protein